MNKSEFAAPMGDIDAGNRTRERIWAENPNTCHIRINNPPPK
jgi:hypothetical protein